MCFVQLCSVIFGHATCGTAFFCEAILRAKVTPMILGGDHAITAPVCAALAVLQTPVATRLELHEYMNRLDLKVDTLFIGNQGRCVNICETRALEDWLSFWYLVYCFFVRILGDFFVCQNPSFTRWTRKRKPQRLLQFNISGGDQSRWLETD